MQDGVSGEYDLPQQRYDRWSWLVVDFEMTQCDLDMQDVWYNAYFETEERLYAVDHASSEVEDGVEFSGSMRKGGRGVTLHDYPPTPASALVGWYMSVMEQSVGGENLLRQEPQRTYPPRQWSAASSGPRIPMSCRTTRTFVEAIRRSGSSGRWR